LRVFLVRDIAVLLSDILTARLAGNELLRVGIYGGYWNASESSDGD
jgi:hypothetical protein